MGYTDATIPVNNMVFIVGMRYLGRITTMIYVCTWSHTLKKIQFLVSNMSKEHGRPIT